MDIVTPLAIGKAATGVLGALGKLASKNTNAASPEPAGAPEPNPRQTLRELAARYDLSWITPKEYSYLIRQLRSAGLLSEEQYRQLASLRIELEAAGLDADRPLNLLDLLTKDVSKDRADEMPNELQQLELDADMRHALAQLVELLAQADTISIDRSI